MYFTTTTADVYADKQVCLSFPVLLSYFVVLDIHFCLKVVYFKVLFSVMLSEIVLC